MKTNYFDKNLPSCEADGYSRYRLNNLRQALGLETQHPMQRDALGRSCHSTNVS